MTTEEFNNATTEIMNNLNDTGEVSNLLANIKTSFGEEVVAKEELQAKVEELENANKKLQEDNMKLFLKIPVNEDKAKTTSIEKNDYSIDHLYRGGRLNLECEG